MAWPTVTAGQAGLSSQFNALSNAIWNWGGPVSSNGFGLTIAASAAATSSANQSSPVLTFGGNYWNGSASVPDLWTIQNVVGSGQSPASNLTISHSGSGSGATYIAVNPLVVFNGGIGMGLNSPLNMGQNTLNFAGGGAAITGTVTISAGITQTSPVAMSSNFTFSNYVTATASANQSAAYTLNWQGAYWNGSASAADTWTFSSSLGAGTNPRSTLQLTHSGSTGIAAFQFGSNLQFYSTPAIAPTTASIRADTSNNILVNGFGAGAVYLGFDSGSGVTNFCNGATSVVASMSAAGVLACAAATFSAPQSIAFGSNWVSYTPVVAASGSMTVSSPGVTDASYVRVGPFVFFKLYLNGTLGGSASNTVTVTIPVAAVGPNSLVSGWVQTATQNWTPGFTAVIPAASFINIQLAGLVNYPLGGFTVLIEGFYRCT